MKYRWEHHTIKEIIVSHLHPGWLYFVTEDNWATDVWQEDLHDCTPRIGDSCSIGWERAEDGTELANGFVIGEMLIYPLGEQRRHGGGFRDVS